MGKKIWHVVDHDNKRIIHTTYWRVTARNMAKEMNEKRAVGRNFGIMDYQAAIDAGYTEQGCVGSINYRDPVRRRKGESR